MDRTRLTAAAPLPDPSPTPHRSSRHRCPPTCRPPSPTRAPDPVVRRAARRSSSARRACSIRDRSRSSGRRKRPARSAGRSCGTCCRRPFGGTVYPSTRRVRRSSASRHTRRSAPSAKRSTSRSSSRRPGPRPASSTSAARPASSAVVIISAGFKEIGPEGVELERQVLEKARRHGIRVIGPNCLGVMNPVGAMNATFAAGIARPGRVGFISPDRARC